MRELKGVLEYAFVVATDGLITPEHLPPKLSCGGPTPTAPPPAGAVSDDDEKTALIKALRQTGGNQSKAAALLGVTRVTVWHRMKKHGIDVRKLITA